MQRTNVVGGPMQRTNVVSGPMQRTNVMVTSIYVVRARNNVSVEMAGMVSLHKYSRPFFASDAVYDSADERAQRWCRTCSAYTRALHDVVLESFWPTRCVLCGTSGHVLCPECEAKLPYLDYWAACPVCGSPAGLHQCVECSSFSLQQKGMQRMPFCGCVSATHFVSESTGHIVRVFKDSGERRLADSIGRIIAQVIPPEWIARSSCVTYIPDSKSAWRRRGFDHGKLLAQSLSAWIHLPCMQMFYRPRSKDQRILSRKKRLSNMEGRFHVIEHDQDMPASVILVDDVYTTGATMCAASHALVQNGIPHVYGATFSRV